MFDLNLFSFKFKLCVQNLFKLKKKIPIILLIHLNLNFQNFIESNKFVFDLTLSPFSKAPVISHRRYKKILLYRLPLYKNRSGLIDIMHIEVEKKTTSSEVIE